MAKKPKFSRDRVRAHRERLRKQGLRPIQIWVLDVSASSFKRAAHRQSLAVATSKGAADDEAFIDSITDQSDA